MNLQSIKNIVLGVLVLIILSLSVCTSIQKNKLAVLQSNLSATNTTLNELYTQTEKDGTLIIKQQQLILNKESDLVKKTEEVEKLKTLKAKVQVITQIKYVEKLVPFKDSTTIVTNIDTLTGDTSQCLVLPANVAYSDSSFAITGTIDTLGLTINKLEIQDTTKVILGDEKKGLFKTNSIVRITHSNPHFNTVGMSNIVVDNRPKNSPLKTFFIGTGVGATLIAILTTAILLR